MKNIPNYLTFVRLGLVPVLMVLLVDPSPAMVSVALVVFTIAAITDILDGVLARRFGAVSDFGKLVDPLADKLLVLTALVMLVGLRSDIYGDPWVPPWMVVLVLGREFWVTGIRAVAASQGVVISAGGAGKAKTVLQMLAIGCLFLHERKIDLLGMTLTYQVVGLNLLFLSILISYWGAVDYTRLVFQESTHIRMDLQSNGEIDDFSDEEVEGTVRQGQDKEF